MRSVNFVLYAIHSVLYKKKVLRTDPIGLLHLGGIFSTQGNAYNLCTVSTVYVS
jgi:hypothetical protein